ncbi:MAG: signal peptidase I [Tenericutes bacterium]|nr:signal peptidase I [Mycoplasmatota bacterium]
MKKAMNKIKGLLFYLIILIFSLYIIIEAFFPDQTVKIFGFKPYVVVTQSMEPEINVFDLVVDKKTDINNLKVGDIITFRVDIDYDGDLDVVTHYIYDFYNDSVTGELKIRTHRHFENPDDVYPDPWSITNEGILGQYMFHIPKLGYVVEFIKSPFGIVTLIFNIAIIATIVYVIKKGKNENEEENKSIIKIDEPQKEEITQPVILSDLTVGELKAMCKTKGITGYSKLKKTELIEKITNVL